MNILVLDVGTSSMRGNLLDERANVLFQRQIKYQPNFYEDGRVEQNPADWENAMARICSEAACHRIDAVAITAQRSSVIPLDQDGNSIHDAMMWQDGRTASICEGKDADLFRNICGAEPNTVFAAPKMTWFQKYLVPAPERYCVIPDYLIHTLTGEWVTDDTYASRTLLMDLRQRRWSAPLLQQFQVEETQLSRIVPVGSVAGRITSDFAQRTGLPQGLPVVSCGGDQQCAALGQGVFTSGRAAVNLGTGAYVLLQTPQVPDDLAPGDICNTASVHGAFLLEKSILTCGSGLDWALNTIYGETDPVRVEHALRHSQPGAGGVIALPYFQGRSTPDWNPHARATFHGISLATTREELLRALLEGISCEVGRHLRSMEIYQAVNEIRVSGGLSNSNGICQLLADVSGRPVRRNARADATTDGAWIVATVALGQHVNPAEAYHCLSSDEQTFCPRKELYGLYRSITRQGDEIYQRLYEKE